MLSRRRWSVIIPTVVVGALTVAIVMWLPATYKATTLMAVHAPEMPEAFVGTSVTTPLEDRLQAMTQQILNRIRLQQVIEKYGLSLGRLEARDGWWAMWRSRVGLNEREEDVSSSSPMLGLVERIRRNIEIHVPRGGNLESTISISFSGEDPQTVTKVTNELAALFIEENLKGREAQAGGTIGHLDNQMQQMKVQLEAYEDQLRVFKERSIGEWSGQRENELRTLNWLQREAEIVDASLTAAENRYADLRQQLALAAAESPESGSLQTELERRLEALRTQLADLRSEYRDEYPDVILLKEEIAAVEAELAAQATREAHSSPSNTESETDSLAMHLADQERQIDALNQRQRAVTEQIRGYETRVENMPTGERGLAVIQRDYETLRRRYQGVLAKRQETEIAESLERGQEIVIFRILAPATVPERPYRPNRSLLMLLGIGGGLAAGLGLAFLRERLDPWIESDDDLVAATMGLPLLAVVPVIPAGGPRSSLREQPGPSIESDDDLVAATMGLPLLAVVPVIPPSGRKSSRGGSSTIIRV